MGKRPKFNLLLKSELHCLGTSLWKYLSKQKNIALETLLMDKNHSEW